MKLIFCANCQDVYKLDVELRQCKCAQTWGRYLNMIDAEYYGVSAVPIGFANSSLKEAIENQPLSGDGKVFTAFVIPKECPTMTKLSRESILEKHLAE